MNLSSRVPIAARTFGQPRSDVGHQIPCPACQKTLVVPAAPASPASGRVKVHLSSPAAQPPAPASTEPPPASSIGAQLFAPPAAGKLSISATSAASTAGAAEAAAQMAVSHGIRHVKRKTPWGSIVGGVVSVAALGVAGYIWGPSVYAKLTHRSEDAAAAAQPVVTNEPPPVVQLTAAEVLQNVINAYKGMTNYKSLAKSVANLTVASGPVSSTVNLSLKFGRPDYYRVDWERQSTMARGSVWSPGKGNFLLGGNSPAVPLKNRDAALGQAAFASGALTTFIAGLFFDETNNLGNTLQNYVRTNDSSANGLDCYVLDGTANFQHVELWVDKKTSLIAQAQIIFSGKLDESTLNDATLRDQLTQIEGKVPSDAELRQKKIALKNAAKIKGTITDTYVDAQTNQTMDLAKFQNSSGSINVQVAAPAVQNRRNPRARSVTSPSDMARMPRQ